MKFITPLIIILLAVLAVYLGKVIYDVSFSKKGSPNVTQTIMPSSSPTSNQRAPWIANLSALEQSFFNIPSSNASTEEKQAFSDLLKKNSRTSSEVHITANCQPSPLVYSVNKAITLNVTNADTVNHTIVMGEKEQYSIVPASSSAIEIGTDKRGLILSYGCDNYGLVGFLITAP